MTRTMKLQDLRAAIGIGCCAGGLLLALGCHTSNSGAPAAADPGSFPAGTYQLSVALQATATVPVSGVDLTLALPAGVSIALASAATGQVDPAALKAGSAVTGPSVVMGTFTAAQKQLHLTLVAAPSAVWSGEAFRVTIQTSSQILLKDLQSLNSTPPAFKAAGLDGAAHSTVLLTSQVTPTLNLLPSP